jgi:hypothetical protein
LPCWSQTRMPLPSTMMRGSGGFKGLCCIRWCQTWARSASTTAERSLWPSTKSPSPISSNGRCRSSTPRSRGHVRRRSLGVDINWVSFDTGTAMSAAMASGDVQIAVSQGVPPFVVATSAGQDLQILDVACQLFGQRQLRRGRGAGDRQADNAGRTGRQEGRRAARHRGALRLPQADGHFGVDISTMEIVDMAPPTARRRFAQGNRSTWSAAGAARCAA